jgi:hypothetical protein
MLQPLVREWAAQVRKRSGPALSSGMEMVYSGNAMSDIARPIHGPGGASIDKGPAAGGGRAPRQFLPRLGPGRGCGGFFASPAHRHLLYLLHALGMGLATFASLYFRQSGYTILQDPQFCVIYALENGLNFGLTFYLVDNWLLRLVGGWGKFQSRTLGKYWLSAALALVVGMILQRGLVYSHIDLYYPKLIHFYDTYPNARPGLLISIWFFGRAWLLLTVGFSLWVYDPRPAEPAKPGNESSPEPDLVLNTPKGKLRLKTAEITHATVEDHYCRIYLLEPLAAGGLYIKMPLKELQACLPKEHFARIHRSHLVNLDHVRQVKKQGRNYWLNMGPSHEELPISRLRLKLIKPRLRHLI